MAKYDPKQDPRVKFHEDESATIELDHKVARGKGDDLLEVTVKPPTMGDMEASDKSDGNVGASMMIVSAVSGLPMAVVRRIRPDDFARIAAVVEG